MGATHEAEVDAVGAGALDAGTTHATAVDGAAEVAAPHSTEVDGAAELGAPHAAEVDGTAEVHAADATEVDGAADVAAPHAADVTAADVGATRRGYELGRRMQRRYDPTYYWAAGRLPAAVRPATHALYGYVRIADQIVDGPRRAATPAGRRAALDAWERQLTQPRHPVAHALRDAAERHGLPLEELDAYMASMRIDCDAVRIGSWPELEAYMDGSAGSVGRIMAPLLGVPERHRAAFGRLGHAFQLANFVRDVREDRRLDRIYLPDRERFGVADADLAADRATPAVRALVAHEVRRARRLFAAAEDAVAAAPGSVRPGIRVAVAAYARMLDRVEATGFDVLGRRTGVRAWQLAGAVVSALRAGDAR